MLKNPLLEARVRGLSSDALLTCIAFANNEILSGNHEPYRVVRYARALYRSACHCETVFNESWLISHTRKPKNLPEIKRLREIDFIHLLDPKVQDLLLIRDHSC